MDTPPVRGVEGWVRGGCAEGGEVQARRCEGKGPEHLARTVGKATSRLPGRSQAENENRMEPGGISFCCVSLSSLSPEQGWGLGGRLHDKKNWHQGDERKLKGNRPEGGLQDLMGVVNQRTWGGLGRWNASPGLGAETQPGCHKRAGPEGTLTIAPHKPEWVDCKYNGAHLLQWQRPKAAPGSHSACLPTEQGSFPGDWPGPGPGRWAASFQLNLLPTQPPYPTTPI